MAAGRSAAAAAAAAHSVALQVVAGEANEFAVLLREGVLELHGFGELRCANGSEVVRVAASNARNPELSARQGSPVQQAPPSCSAVDTESTELKMRLNGAFLRQSYLNITPQLSPKYSCKRKCSAPSASAWKSGKESPKFNGIFAFYLVQRKFKSPKDSSDNRRRKLK